MIGIRDPEKWTKMRATLTEGQYASQMHDVFNVARVSTEMPQHAPVIQMGAK
jgi:hypothetical protein